MDFQQVRTQGDTVQIRHFSAQDAAFQPGVNRLQFWRVSVLFPEHFLTQTPQRRVRAVLPCGIVTVRFKIASEAAAYVLEPIEQRLLFGECPSGLEDFIFGSQVVQAEAMKYFVEMWRSQKFAPKTGIIWWNIKDGWPDISDAVVDYYFNKKLAYYFIKNVQLDVCCMITDPVKGSHLLVAVNDTASPVDGSAVVTDVASGKTVWKGIFSVAKNGRTEVARIPYKKGKQGVYLIEYKVGDRQFKNHYLYGEVPFKASDYRAWMEKTGIYDLNIQ